MSKFNTTKAIVHNYCFENKEQVVCLDPKRETYSNEVESITRLLSLKVNRDLTRSTVERNIRAWKQVERTKTGQ